MECYICFYECNTKCKCKCNLYVHEECLKKYGKIKNYYSSKDDNVYFIHCPICDDTIIYNFNIESIKKIKKNKCCFLL